MNKMYLSVFIAMILFTSINALNINNESTIIRYTRYKDGIESFEDKIIVNAYTCIELYNIQADCALALQNVIDINGLVRSLKLDRVDNVLYALIAGYNSDIQEEIYAYDIIGDDFVFKFKTNINESTYFNIDDCVYQVGEYVILGQGSNLPVYNKISDCIETVNYQYDYIIGSYDDKLVDYNCEDSVITFYKIVDINDPEILYQYEYDLLYSYKCSIRKFDNTPIMLTNTDEIILFQENNEDDIDFLTTYEIDLALSNQENFDCLNYPLIWNDDYLYVGTILGENFVYDISDVDSPIQIYNWVEESTTFNDYCLVNQDLLIKSKNEFGIWCYNLSILPLVEHTIMKSSKPICNGIYSNGYLYTVLDDCLYKTGTDTVNWDFICDIPIETVWEYIQYNDLIIIYGMVNGTNTYIIIDPNVNLLLNTFTCDGSIVYTISDKIFIENENMLDIFEVNDSYETEYLCSFGIGNSLNFTYYDINRVWISSSEGDFLFNTENLNLEINYGNIFSPDSYSQGYPYFFQDKMIYVEASAQYSANVSLYDISLINNPIFLDSKVEEVTPIYYSIGENIIETQFDKPIRLYRSLDENFNEPLEYIDLETLILNLTIDYDRSSLVSFTPYCIKSYTYDDVDVGFTNYVNQFQSKIFSYPNPFNPATTISYNLKTETKVELEIYNVKGQMITTLVNEKQERGEHSQTWDGRDNSGEEVSSGVYLYKLKTDYDETVSRMMLIK